LKKKKLVSAVLTASLPLGGVLSVHASSIISTQYTNLNPNPYGNAANVDSYVTAIDYDNIYDYLHVNSGYVPQSFRADLKLRTAWYLPNEIEDAVYTPEATLRSYANSGQQFRTKMSATFSSGSQWCEEKTQYEN
jgi:hypothetical protein